MAVVLSRLPEVDAAMSAGVDIKPSASVEEIYEQLARIEHLHVELLFGRVVVTGSASIRHGEIVYQLFLMLVDLARPKTWTLFHDQAVHIAATRDRVKPDLAVAPYGAPIWIMIDMHSVAAPARWRLVRRRHLRGRQAVVRPAGSCGRQGLEAGHGLGVGRVSWGRQGVVKMARVTLSS
jgi:hypothetical protein